MRRFLCLFGVLLSTPTTLYATQADVVASDSIRCAGLFFVMTSITEEEPQFGEAMTGLGRLMGQIYAVNRGAITGEVVTNGKVAAARDVAAKELGSLYDLDPAKVVRTFQRCNAWREKISAYLQPQIADAPSLDPEKQRDILLAVPSAPYEATFNPHTDARVAVLVESAFSSWTKMGRPTHEDFKDALNKFIKP